MSGRVVWERANHGYVADVGEYMLLVMDPDAAGRCEWEVCATTAWFDEHGTADDLNAAMREAVKVLKSLTTA